MSIKTTMIPTTREVATAIRAAHRDDLRVFATWSFTGDMMTEWGLKGAEVAILRQRTTYDEALHSSGYPVRVNENHEQWLIVAVGVEDES